MLCGGLVTCPTCRTDQGITSAEKLATEYSILAIIAAQECSKSEMCPHHDVKLAFWCRTCHEPACGECLFEDHPIHVHDVVKSKDHISQLKDLATRRTDSALEVMGSFETKYLYGIFAAFAAMCESLKKVMMLHHDMEEGRQILTGILDAEGISAAAAMADASKGLNEKWGAKENEYMASKNNRMNTKNSNKNNNNNSSNSNNNKVNGNNNTVNNNNAATNTLKKKKKRKQTSDFPDLVEESTPAEPSGHKGEQVSVAAAAAAVVAAAAAAAEESVAAAAEPEKAPTGTRKTEEPRSSTPPPKPLRVNGAVTAPDFANSRYSIRKTKTLSDLQMTLTPLPKTAPGQAPNSKSRRGSSNEASIGPSRSPTPERKPVRTQNKQATPEKTPPVAQPSPELQPPPPPPLPPPPPPKPETRDASTNTEEREPTPPPAPPTPPPPAAASMDDALIPHPCPESVAIAIAQMEQRLISESTDGQLAKILWEPNGMHVYCHQWQDIAYDLCIKAPLLRSLILSKNPRVFLDINADDRRLGRVYITLWGHMRRAQNFLVLCLGDMGPSYRGAKFFNVYNGGDQGERLVCGDYEYNNGRGGASMITDLEKSVEQLYPMDEGIVVAGSIGRPSMDAMFVICTKGDPSRTVACPFGMVTSGLSVLQEAARHYAYAEIWINDCGVLLWESPLQPIDND